MILKTVRNAMGVATMALVFAGSAAADGRDRSPIVGPSPLKPIECQHGHYADGSCYVPQHTTRIVQQPAVTRRVVTQAPSTVVRRVVQAPQQTQGYDFSGFTGGVGGNAGGGFAGGGGGNVIIIRDGQRFSGVRSSAVGRAVLNGTFTSGTVRTGGCSGCGGW